MTNGTTMRTAQWGRWPGLLVALALAVSSLGAGGCATSQRDGLDVAQLPETVRPDYALFARRCSKCHSLARPLGSGITDDAVWIAYVDKMRRQPGSGISPQDAAPILRFLHYYSSEQRRIKRERDEASGGPANPALSDASKPPASPKIVSPLDGTSRDGLHSASLAPSTP
jgi:hypothetical protein